MIELGKKQTLTIVKKLSFGAYLADTTDPEYSGDAKDEVLLPLKELPPGTGINDTVDVFIYRDSSDRLIATVKNPLITLGEVKTLTVKEVGKIGAFLDWGLPKDLLLPFKEQIGRPLSGDEVTVRMYIDKSDRLCASMLLTDRDKKHSSYENNAEKLLDIIKKKKGILYLTDSSSPEEIKAVVHMSKKEFKRAVGNLYKRRAIELFDDYIKIVN